MTEQQNVKGWLAIAKDVLHALHLPGGETLGAAVEKAIERRNRATFEILLAALANGERDGVRFVENDVEQLADMVLRLLAAAGKGAAKKNLRLLAQVIVGLKRNKAFEFDHFQKWANVLETLTRKEILVLGRAYRISESSTGEDSFWSALRTSLSDTLTEAEIEETVAGLSRTGLLIPASGWGALVYSAGPSLAELGSLAELEANSLQND